LNISKFTLCLIFSDETAIYGLSNRGLINYISSLDNGYSFEYSETDILESQTIYSHNIMSVGGGRFYIISSGTIYVLDGGSIDPRTSVPIDDLLNEDVYLVGFENYMRIWNSQSIWNFTDKGETWSKEEVLAFEKVLTMCYGGGEWRVVIQEASDIKTFKCKEEETIWTELSLELFEYSKAVFFKGNFIYFHFNNMNNMLTVKWGDNAIPTNYPELSVFGKHPMILNDSIVFIGNDLSCKEDEFGAIVCKGLFEIVGKAEGLSPNEVFHGYGTIEQQVCLRGTIVGSHVQGSVCIEGTIQEGGGDSVVIGHNCETHEGRTVSIGLSNIVNTSQGVHIGCNNKTEMFGDENHINGKMQGNVLIGSSNTARMTDQRNYADSGRNVMIGVGNMSEYSDTVLIGKDITAQGDNDVWIGTTQQGTPGLIRIGCLSISFGSDGLTFTDMSDRDERKCTIPWNR
jgi:hypothetical protein